MENEDREENLFHGTTLEVAQRISAIKQFELRETYFASTQELANYFAVRSCGKRSEGKTPAVVKVSLYASDIKQWKVSRLITSKGFDGDDRPELKGKTQLVFSPAAMRLLNVYMFKDELSVDVVKGDA